MLLLCDGVRQLKCMIQSLKCRKWIRSGIPQSSKTTLLNSSKSCTVPAKNSLVRGCRSLRFTEDPRNDRSRMAGSVRRGLCDVTTPSSSMASICVMTGSVPAAVPGVAIEREGGREPGVLKSPDEGSPEWCRTAAYMLKSDITEVMEGCVRCLGPNGGG